MLTPRRMRPSSPSPSGTSEDLTLVPGGDREEGNIPESDKDSETVKDRLAERQARAAVALLRMGKAEEVWPLLRHSADPRLRSFIVNWLNPLGADPKVIAAELERIDPGNAKPTPAQRPTDDGCHPVPSRDLAAAGVDPGAGDVRDGRAVSRRAGAVDRQAARPLPQRPRQPASTGRRNGPCGNGSSRRSSRNWMPS